MLKFRLMSDDYQRIKLITRIPRWRRRAAEQELRIVKERRESAESIAEARVHVSLNSACGLLLHLFERKAMAVVTFAVMILATTLGLSVVPTAEGQEFAITYQGQRVGSIENIRLDAPSRLLISSTARFDSFSRTLDRILTSRGNFGSCPKRIFWAGNTSIRDAGESLALSSRARYEQWICSSTLGFKTKLFRSTFTVHWRLFIRPGEIENIRIEARLENIDDFSDSLEELLGLRIKENIRIPVPVRCGECDCSQVTGSLNPALEGVGFSRDGETVRLKVTFSLEGDLTGMLPCFAD